MELKEHLTEYFLHYSGWVSGGTLERMEWPTKKGGLFKPGSVGRVLREMSQEVDEYGLPLVPFLGKKRENNTIFYRLKEYLDKEE